MAGYVQGESSGLLGAAKLVDLNDSVSDVEIPVAHSRYIVRRVVVTDASVDLTATATTFGVYTDIDEGGTAIVTTGTELNADVVTDTDAKDLTLAAGAVGTRLTATTLYAHVEVPHGSAATISVYVFGDSLP